MGDGRRKEKEVRGAGSGSKMFSRVEGYAVYSLYNLRLYSLYILRLSRFDGYAVWHAREKERRRQRHWRNTPLFVSSRTKETCTPV